MPQSVARSALLQAGPACMKSQGVFCLAAQLHRVNAPAFSKCRPAAPLLAAWASGATSRWPCRCHHSHTAFSRGANSKTGFTATKGEGHRPSCMQPGWGQSTQLTCMQRELLRTQPAGAHPGPAAGQGQDQQCGACCKPAVHAANACSQRMASLCAVVSRPDLVVTPVVDGAGVRATGNHRRIGHAVCTSSFAAVLCSGRAGIWGSLRGCAGTQGT